MNDLVPPSTAGEIALTAYCELTGRESRLPLQLKGLGLGPKATWLYESLDIGDVYVNSEHRYEVVLENHGDIDCDYSLAPNDSRDDRPGQRFTFSPNAGHLKSRQQQLVEVRFFCTHTHTTTTAAAPPTSPPSSPHTHLLCCLIDRRCASARSFWAKSTRHLSGS